ncbi:AI-2E family transporter [Catelliglobosispora koreensis]|uniref:AI-2E family transporter n=1 Tax=Catelliglobosispora koreensis TaxID=129052 RepID=UPI00037E5D8D|nr:AI-2E family transporter [Catelliglobosispora koreensis]
MGRFEQARANIRRAYEAVRAARVAEDQRTEHDALEAAETAVTELNHSTTISRDDVHVAPGVRIAGAWAWRLIAIAVVGWGVFWLMGRLSIVIIPLTIAMLLTALLSPAVGWLRRARVHPSLATTIVVIGGIAAIVGTLTLVVNSFVEGLPELTTKAEAGLTEVQNWLRNGPLHLNDFQLQNLIKQAQEMLNANKDSLTSGAIHTATTAIEVLSGTFLAIFALFFFLRDGRKIWKFSLFLVPARAREPMDRAAVAAWRSLVSYVRATVLVAFIDAVGIGTALLLVKIPPALALPLAALVFLTAFIPIIGATLSGAVAVLVALVIRGPVVALIVLGAVIAVQQIEGHLLQPLIMGRAVAIHPLAVIVGIAAGLVLGGIIGALIAVPLIAMLNTGIRVLAERPRPEVEKSIEAAEATP